MHQKYGLKVQDINIRASKIDDSTLQISRIVLASFQLENKLRKAQFFRKPFLLADINIQVILEMSFLTFSNIDILFSK